MDWIDAFRSLVGGRRTRRSRRDRPLPVVVTTGSRGVRGAEPGAGGDPPESGPDDEPRRLRAEVVRQYARGRFAEAADAARALVAWQRTTVGDRHPDYARALASLALLLAKVGDGEEAARLMGEAAAIRREVLGAAHPETIEAESHLVGFGAAGVGGSSASRAPVTGAGPLGPRPFAPTPSPATTPASAPDANGQGKPAALATPMLLWAKPGPAGLATATNGAGAGAATAANLSGSIVTLADRLNRLGMALAALGRLPDPAEFDELNACRAQLDTLCRRVARTLGRDEPPSRPAATTPAPAPAPVVAPTRAAPTPVPNGNGRGYGPEPAGSSGAGAAAPRPAPILRPDRLSPVGSSSVPSASPLPAGATRPGSTAHPVLPPMGATPRFAAPASAPRPVAAASPPAQGNPPPPRPAGDTATEPVTAAGRPREAALAVLDRVLRLTMVGSGDPGVLTPCLMAAESLRAAIRAEPPAAPAAAIADLAAGRHAFASLLALIERREAMNDAVWAAHHEAIAVAFGKPLALAVSRGRIRPLS